MEKFYWSGNLFFFYSTGRNCVSIQKVWCSADNTIHMCHHTMYYMAHKSYAYIVLLTQLPPFTILTEVT